MFFNQATFSAGRLFEALSPTKSQNPTTPRTTTTTQANNQDTATPNPNCLRRCLTTPEYNPVCGNNMQDYDNMSRLSCARQCGIPGLALLRSGRCPRQ